jgi:putative effector of murein hydrolase
MEYSIIISTLIVSVAVILIFQSYYRSKERRALIEKGLDPSLVNIYSNTNFRKLFLFAGIITLGVALGILTGIALAIIFTSRQDAEDFILLSVLIITGISLLVCYYLSGNKSN